MNDHIPAVRALSQYAAYHRDKRNIGSHFVGIPLIWLAIATLLARPSWGNGWLMLSPMVLVGLALCAYYFRLQRTLGWIMLAVMAITYIAAVMLAAQSTAVWLASAVLMLAVGWLIQFAGHYYEQRKPAFFDDIRGLIIGPVFMAAEACFLLGRLPELKAAIEEQVGPTLIKPRP